MWAKNENVEKFDKFLEENPTFFNTYTGSCESIAQIFKISYWCVFNRKSWVNYRKKEKTIDTQKVPKIHIEERILNTERWVTPEHTKYWEWEEELVWQRPIQWVKFEKNKVWYINF